MLTAKRKVREHDGLGARELERVKNNQLHTKAIISVYVSADLAPLSYWTLGPRRSRLFKIENSTSFMMSHLKRLGDVGKRRKSDDVSFSIPELEYLANL